MKKPTVTVLLFMALLTLPMLAIPNAIALPTDLTTMQGDRIGEPMDIDPAWAYDTSSAELLMNVYDPLLWFNRTSTDTCIPILATEWKFEAIAETSPLGLPWGFRVTFKIREGVYFQSDGVNDIPGEGALLTTDDVEYTFERLLVTDAKTGPAWTMWYPLFAGDAWDISAQLDDLGYPTSPTGSGFNSMTDEAIDQAIESDATHVWFNLAMPYEPFLQILSQSWGSIMNRAWCVWHINEWPGMQVGDDWYLYTDPAVSPLLEYSSASPGPHLDCALGTGPYMLDYWNKGTGGSWSIIKNSNYWEGWAVPFRHEGWGASEEAIGGHVDRYTSNYIPAWATRRARFVGGVSDFCDVPRKFKDQVLGQPGVVCDYPLPQLVCEAFCFNFLVNPATTHLGHVTPDGTFSQYGAPLNIMSDSDFRLAMTHMFNYDLYLLSAYHNEATSPPTPIIPDSVGYDPSVPKPEYDMNLAKTYLQAAWGGELWDHGFRMDACYPEGNYAGEIAANMMKASFDYFNSLYGTAFTLNTVSIQWSFYRTEQSARLMPMYWVSWQADFMDPNSLAHSFWHSKGAISKFQGYSGVTAFPNAEVDSYVYTAFATGAQSAYTWLQQYYVNTAPGFVTAAPIGRHFERDWVQGWYYNILVKGDCGHIYDLWKAIAVTPVDVDVGITDYVAPEKFEVGFPVPDNEVILPFPSPVTVTVQYVSGGVGSVMVEITVSLVDDTYREVVLDIDTALIPKGGSYTAEFYEFTQDPAAPIYPGIYTVKFEVYLMSGFANDINTANNIVQIPSIEAAYLMGDANCDGTVDMADISLCLDAFMSDPTSPHWDIRCDVIADSSVDMADVAMMIDAFMVVFDP